MAWGTERPGTRLSWPEVTGLDSAPLHTASSRRASVTRPDPLNASDSASLLTPQGQVSRRLVSAWQGKFKSGAPCGPAGHPLAAARAPASLRVTAARRCSSLLWGQVMASRLAAVQGVHLPWAEGVQLDPKLGLRPGGQGQHEQGKPAPAMPTKFFCRCGTEWKQACLGTPGPGFMSPSTSQEVGKGRSQSLLPLAGGKRPLSLQCSQ